MKLAAKKLSIAALTAVFIFWLVAASAYAAQPYFKAFGGDVFAGGWFNNITSCPQVSGSNYQDPSFSQSPLYPATSDYFGGIQAYAHDSGAKSGGGASTQYGAFSLGSIDGPAGGVKGFYSAGALAATQPGYSIDKNLLDFANNNSVAPSWGGLLQGGNGSTRQSHCIPDYYTLKIPNPAPGPLASLSSATGPGVYAMTTTCGATPICLNGLSGSGAVTIHAGKNITIFVNSSVYIGNNITYGLDRDDNIPKFALVVKGSIYIDPSVTQLDGFYIAQPDPSSAINADDGIIWTCHNSSNSQPTLAYMTACTNRLLVNGALSAKQVNFLRMKGDVNTASPLPPAEDSFSYARDTSTNIAEIINYTPVMVMGGPFFSPSPPATLKVESLISLPPVF